MATPGNQPGGDGDWLDDVTQGDPVGNGEDGDPQLYRYVPGIPAEELYPPYGLDPLPYQSSSQEVAPPSRTKRVIYSLPFYFAVMGGLTALAWLAAAHLPWAAASWTAIAISVLAALLCALRIFRGNAMYAEDDVREELQRLKPVSDRMQRQLWPNEKVKWETRRHPISIIPTVLRRLTLTKWRRRFTFAYLMVLGIVMYSNVGAGLLVGLVGVLAVAFTVMEWARVRYAITTERIMAVEKLIGKAVPAMPSAKLTDIVVSEHWFAVFLAWLRIVRVPWGTWNVESAGQDQALKWIYYLPAAVIAAAVFSLGRSPSSDDGT